MIRRIRSRELSVKFIFALLCMIFSLRTFAYQCLLDPKLTKEAQAEVCRKGGEDYVRWQQELQRGHEERSPKVQPWLELARAEAEIQSLYDYNCKKKGKFQACEQYRHYLTENSKHALDAACKRNETCIQQYLEAMAALKEFALARDAAASSPLFANYPTVFLHPREVADESRAYDEVVSRLPAMRETAAREFTHRLCRDARHEALGSDPRECRRFTDAFLKAKAPGKFPGALN